MSVKINVFITYDGASRAYNIRECGTAKQDGTLGPILKTVSTSQQDAKKVAKRLGNLCGVTGLE